MKINQHIMKIMVFLCIIFLSACRKSEESSSGQNTQHTFSSYILEGIESSLISVFVDNIFYYIKQIQGGQEIRAYDMESREDRIIHHLEEDIATGRNYDLILMSASEDGKIALLNRINDETDTRYEMIILDITGNVLHEYEITEYFKEPEQERFVKCVIFGEEDAIYLALSGNNDIIVGLDKKGREQFKINCEEPVFFLFSDSFHQVYGVCESTNGNTSSLLLWKLDLPTRTFVNTWQIISDTAGSDVYVAESQGVLLISEGRTLSKFNMENGKKEEILQWITVNIDFLNIKKIAISKSGIIGVLIHHTGLNGKMPHYEIVSISEAGAMHSTSTEADHGSVAKNDLEEPVQREKTTLIYATMNLDHTMNSWIVDYNRRQEDHRIEVKDYGENGYEAGLVNFNIDMVSGNIPDLIDLNDIHIGPYISKGILTDLYPFLDADPAIAKQDLVSSMLQLYEDNGKIYGIAPSYRLETLMGKEFMVGDASDWTTQKMRTLVEAMPEESVLINNLAPLGLLRIILTMGMDEYVNWEDAICSFDDDSFIQLLELAASIRTITLEMDDISQGLSQESILLNRVYISDVGEYKEALNMFQGEETVCVGYPSPKGGSALVYTRFSIGISDVSQNKEAAWEFVRSLLEEEFQDKHVKFNFPIRISSLEKKLEQAMEIQNNDYGYNNPLATQEEIAVLYEVINTSYSSMLFDINIWNIIEEETEHYFNGNKTVEQTAHIIQNRVEIYLNENF